MKEDTNNFVIAVIPRKTNNKQEFLTYLPPSWKFNAGKYRLIGGRLKVGENYEQAIKREFLEEFSVKISEVQLLVKKKNHKGGDFYLCCAKLIGEAKKSEEDVGEPLWRGASELITATLALNGKTALYAYLVKYEEDLLTSIISDFAQDQEFINFLEKEVNELFLDVQKRIKA